MNKERKSNFELLRIIAMLFIVVYHTIYHGNVLSNSVNPGIKIIVYLLMLITIVHVNSFVMITGFFQSKSSFKQSKLWSIINSSWFYRIVIVSVISFLGIEHLSKLEILKETFILDLTEYWFIKTYILLYCISPFLNKMINSLSKKEYQIMLIVVFIIFCVFPYLSGNQLFLNDGYSLYHFTFMYMLGGYFRKYPLETSYLFKIMSKKLLQISLIFIFFSCVLINFSINQTMKSIGNTNSLLLEISNNLINMTQAYSNPILVIQTIAFFCFFSILDFKNRFINSISKLVLGVYFIHDNYYVRKYIYKLLTIDVPNITSYNIIIKIFIVAIAIFVACLIIEKIRQIIFQNIGKLRICQNIRKKYYNFVKNIYIKS